MVRAAVLMAVDRARDHRRSPATACRALPTGFLPIEDQGYLLATVQLPDGASLERTQTRARQRAEIARKTAGRRAGASPSPASPRSTTAPSLANAGVAYVMLKDWSERGKGAGSAARCSPGSTGELATDRGGARSSCCRRRRSRASAMPAASPCRSSCATAASTSPSCRPSPTPWSTTRRRQSAHAARDRRSFRADVPQFTVDVDRVKAQTLRRHRRPGVRDARRLSRLEPMSTSSTSSAAPSRSMCRPIRNSACAPRTSTSSPCATRTAT